MTGNPIQFTKKEMLEALKEVNERFDGPLTVRNYDKYRDNDYPAGRTINDRFENWNTAKKKAGLKIHRRYCSMDKSTILEKLKKADDFGEGYMSRVEYKKRKREMDEVMPSLVQISDKFGSWKLAKLEAGLGFRKNQYGGPQRDLTSEDKKKTILCKECMLERNNCGKSVEKCLELAERDNYFIK